MAISTDGQVATPMPLAVGSNPSVTTYFLPEAAEELSITSQ